MSSSSRGRLTRLRETTFATLPTPAAMTVIRRTGGSFEDDNNRSPSEEVRDDLQNTDAPRENYMVKGSIEDEWTYGCHEAELQDVFGNTKSATINLSSLTLTFAASGNTVTRSAGSWVSDGIVPGGVYKFGGSGAAGNNIRNRVVSVDSATQLTLFKPVTNDGPTASCTVTQGGHFRLGTSLYSSIFEELYADIGATEIWQYLGMVCVGWDWNFSHPGKMKTSFQYEGASHGYTASTAGNGTVTAYPTNRAMNSISHFSGLYEGGAAATLRVKELSHSLKAPKGVIDAAGTLGAVGFRMDTYELTGSMQVYNSAVARTFAMKAKNDTNTGLEWEEIDAAGNVIHKYIPSIYLNKGAPSMGPKNQNVYVTVPWVAVRDPTIASLMQVTLFPAS